VDARVTKVFDVKTPASGESQRNLYAEMAHLMPHDQIKFVICDRADYEWSRDCIERLGLAGKANVLFSPSAGQLAPRELADWILADRLPVRLQLQLHKLLWGEVPGR
jgi:7-carboxy-7-deazaguanine synthase